MTYAIQTLWVGDALSTMERLCLRSFLAHDHEVHLYTYGAVSGITSGVTVKDAREILPESRIFTYKEHASYAGFSNFFRYKLLLERGGWWVDSDMVCLRPFDFEAEHVFSSERHPDGSTRVNVGAVKAAVGSPAMQYAWERCQSMDPQRLQWGQCGPLLMAEALRETVCPGYVVQPGVFCPVNFFDWEQMLDAGADAQFSEVSYGLHLWNEMWRRAGTDKNANFAPGCLYEKLKAAYEPKSTIRGISLQGADDPSLPPPATLLPRRAIRSSAVVLTKNGEERIAACLESIRDSGFAEELVVCVDAACTDNTAAVARSYTPYVYRVPTEGNLESALPQMISHCRGDWILRIDDDETLEGKWQWGEVAAMLERNGTTHAWIPRRWTLPDGRFIAQAPWFPDRQMRLFRNAPTRIKWPGMIHEPLEVEGCAVELTDQWIDHHILRQSSREEREAKCRHYQSLRADKHLSHFYLYEDLPLVTLPAAEEGFFEALGRSSASEDSSAAIYPTFYEWGDELFFGQGGNAQAFLRQGWSSPEPWGTWTEAHCATLHLCFREPVREGVRFIVEANAHVGPTHPVLRVCVVCRSLILADWFVRSSDFVAREFCYFPPKGMPAPLDLTLEFHIINAVSPLQAGASGDTRLLGLGFRSMRAQVATADEIAACGLETTNP